ncbi:P-loop containing nucleoside triphosphate hydrolase protein [Auriscalpium vulgare]|uniref:P-loop containing nucleoside triphosphate hydrolase protein n=1 Tax=Auriscalpium vulgare TaxID=40419 RepID=A0ACB8RXD9_9AGAM|nr:P-loop containing nucleoside triphosphate hydrolase protein [Auriscalpium vulgare]
MRSPHLHQGIRAFGRAQQGYATKAQHDAIFANPRSAGFLAAALTEASVPTLQGIPEVVVTGRANAGKSTLLNAILGRKDLVLSSSKPGRTKSLNFFRVGPDPGKLILVDAPGYGSRGRPEWGQLFSHYLGSRKELRRVYILFNAKHGINAADKLMLEDLNAQALGGGLPWTLQAIITKSDTVSTRELATVLPKLQKTIFEVAPTCLPPIVTASLKHPLFGVTEVRKSIAEACGLLKVDANLLH